jgi:hypothetical protein
VHPRHKAPTGRLSRQPVRRRTLLPTTRVRARHATPPVAALPLATSALTLFASLHRSPLSHAIPTAYVRSHTCPSASLPSPPGRAPPSVGKVAAPQPSLHRQPPHPLLCTGAHLFSIFPCRSLPSRACPSAAEADRLPHPCLRHLDVAGEDPSPCAASSPHRPRARVVPSCRRPLSTMVQSQRRAVGVTRGQTPRVHEPSALVVTWAAFQCRSRVRGLLAQCRQAGQPK